MKKRLNIEAIANELKGGSAFFPDYKTEGSPTADDVPKPAVTDALVETSKPTVTTQPDQAPVPLGVPLPVRGTVSRTPKVKRAIKQRQPFDIFEDQYLRLKGIAEAEREFEDGRGMSQMVREAIDLYLKDHFPNKE